MAYRTGGTAWIRAARERGLPASDGSDMLVEQGAAAFRDWFGTDAPRRAMIDALATD
jgi:shikimate dehydrogenase